jgi:FtsZ-binding cell division protein ZapB
MPTRPERQAETARRRAQVLQARLAGATFEQIGRQLGVTTQRAHQLYADALRGTVQEPSNSLRDLELGRLDQVTLKLNQALQDDRQVVAAALALVRVSESRRKLLGLDAPTKVQAQVQAEVYSIDALDEELKRLNQQLTQEAPDLAAQQQHRRDQQQALDQFQATWSRPGAVARDPGSFVGDGLALLLDGLDLDDEAKEQAGLEVEQLLLRLKTMPR